jgi:hypothetical protein
VGDRPRAQTFSCAGWPSPGDLMCSTVSRANETELHAWHLLRVGPQWSNHTHKWQMCEVMDKLIILVAEITWQYISKYDTVYLKHTHFLPVSYTSIKLEKLKLWPIFKTTFIQDLPNLSITWQTVWGMLVITLEKT